MDVEKELMHWGILGMKWGVRRFQNEDGSLTPAGRERYGVGFTKQTRGLNDASSLSNEELRSMEKRYRSQANYYNARNSYLEEQQRYAQLTAPKKKQTSQFMRKVFVEPFQNVTGKANEAAMGYMGGALIGAIFGEGAENFIENYYYKSLYGGGNKNKDKDKDNNDKQQDNLQKPQNQNQNQNNTNNRNNSNRPAQTNTTVNINTSNNSSNRNPNPQPRNNQPKPKKNPAVEYEIDFGGNTTIDIGDGFYIDIAKAIEESDDLGHF